MLVKFYRHFILLFPSNCEGSQNSDLNFWHCPSDLLKTGDHIFTTTALIIRGTRLCSVSLKSVCTHGFLQDICPYDQKLLANLFQRVYDQHHQKEGIENSTRAGIHTYKLSKEAGAVFEAFHDDLEKQIRDMKTCANQKKALIETLSKAGVSALL